MHRAHSTELSELRPDPKIQSAPLPHPSKIPEIQSVLHTPSILEQNKQSLCASSIVETLISARVMQPSSAQVTSKLHSFPSAGTSCFPFSSGLSLSLLHQEKKNMEGTQLCCPPNTIGQLELPAHACTLVRGPLSGWNPSGSCFSSLAVPREQE